MSLLYLRTRERVTYEVTPEHKQHLKEVIGDLALKLREEEIWQPKCGEQCKQCSYARFCSAVQTQPEPLPIAVQQKQKLQLCLSL